MAKLYDFGGYCTRDDIRCNDGTVIRKGCFAHNDGETVSLFYHHNHKNKRDLVGNALLELRDDGMYAYGSLNPKHPDFDLVKSQIEHGDLPALSIFANHLQRRGNDIYHGDIKEVSLVISGSDRTAVIDRLDFAHADEDEEDNFSAQIFCGEDVFGLDTIEHADNEDPKKEDEKVADENKKPEGNEKSVQEVIDSMTEEQKEAMHYVIGLVVEQIKSGKAPEEDAEDSVKHDDLDDDTDDISEEDNNMGRYNAFENNGEQRTGNTISHDDLEQLYASSIIDAMENNSAKWSSYLMQHAKNDLQHDDLDLSMTGNTQNYGIINMELLFPDATNVNKRPEFIKRDTEGVASVINGTTHVPFTKIKSMIADITADEARARGYIKGQQKIEEFFPIAKRETTPQTIYKMQKLDRDDLLDTDDPVGLVAWMDEEMTLMIREEIARCILIGDGRSIESQYHVSHDKVRPIVTDHDVYTVKTIISSEAYVDPGLMVEEISKAHKDYKGSGNPTFFTTVGTHTNMLWTKDQIGRKIYTSDAELQSALRVSKIEEVELMEDLTVTIGGVLYDVIGIKVNLKDYYVGTNKGGELTSFKDFDMDFNQNKYLKETRLSGALVKPKSAQVFLHVHGAAPSKLTLNIAPNPGYETLYGIDVSDMQSNIQITNDGITGTLKYIEEGWDAGTWGADEDEGNYLALKFEADPGATVQVQVVNGVNGPVTLDDDMWCVFRITNKTTQKIRATSTIGGKSITKTYDLSGLTLNAKSL